jgi:hypothetical protein
MRTYCVYLHTNKINGKKYFGITCLKPEKRWNSGKGYSTKQPRLYSAIKKYGWNNFAHEVLFDGLTKDQAIELEIKLIKEYNTTNVAFGYNNTIGGEGHTFYSTEEEKQQARVLTLEKYNAKLQQDPIRLEKIKQHRRDHANTKYQELQENSEEYARRLKEANERVKIRKQNPVEHQKILESKKRCKQKAMQDPKKKAKILEANRNSKQVTKALRVQLFSLYENYPDMFTAEDVEIVFTKFSPESGCFKYNSAKRLQQILNEVTIKIGCN